MTHLKKDFIWGTAASSFQIEGATQADGRGDSVWDMVCRQPGFISDSSNGDQACNHYHLFQEDVSLMAELGIQAYRLSVSWPRIFPEGIGKINDKGVDFYDRLVDQLLSAGIDPWITLFHWDYPLELYKKGGWFNPDSPNWFADYAQVVTEHLSDRVKNWFTLNEPQCFLGLGHQTGTHAPGLKCSFEEILLATHHSLLAHGKAVQVMRAHAKQPLKIGAAPVGVVHYPARNTPELIEAARQSMFRIKRLDCFNNSWYADPMIKGHYPEDGLALFEPYLPKIGTNDLSIINQPLDMYAVNIYTGKAKDFNSEGQLESVHEIGCGRTTMGWDVKPEVLYWGPKFLYERYGLPLVVTENGMANSDWVQSNGEVADPARIDFMQQYLKCLDQAAQDGVDIDGYFYWSILDNFEWDRGYQQRFGMVHVDFQTQKRTPKHSAYWYRDLIASNGGKLVHRPL